jgi:hypothetical protein
LRLPLRPRRRATFSDISSGRPRHHNCIRLIRQWCAQQRKLIVMS